jgi:hypothetical protein
MVKKKVALNPETIRGLGLAGLLDLVERDRLSIMMTIDETPEDPTLNGKPIWVSEASRKYSVPIGTISRWIQKGYVRPMGKAGNKTLVDEGSIARAARKYQKNPGKGKSTMRKKS